jgi:L-alanine-DL-glutamate epimerase-like enolase superfamily enzyme
MGERLKGYTFTTPDQLFDDFSDFLNINSFALAALNNASWDLYGKIAKSPVVNLIDLQVKSTPLTSYTLGIASREEMLKKIMDFPWPIYKIKLGTKDDLEIIKSIRNCTNSIIRVDANCAWSAVETINISKELKDLDVEFIEQPLAVSDQEQSVCFEKSMLPLVADESCCRESDVKKCVNLFHGINIKLLKCGGLSPAIRMIREARKLRLKIMVGCMTETSVGIAAAAQLLPFIDQVDLDGPLLLSEDLAHGITYHQGKISLSGKNGFGINFTKKD